MSKDQLNNKVVIQTYTQELSLTSIIKDYFKIEGSVQQRYKRTLFSYKRLQKGTSNLNNPYFHSTFTLNLIKNFKKINYQKQLNFIWMVYY